MEQINLIFKGETHSPPSGISTDGDCSHVVNLRYKDGAWRPIGFPETLYVPADESRKIIFVHKNESYEHYISYDGASVYYECYEDDGVLQATGFYKFADLPGLIKVESCGNTLIFLVMPLLRKQARFRLIRLKKRHYKRKSTNWTMTILLHFPIWLRERIIS